MRIFNRWSQWFCLCLLFLMSCTKPEAETQPLPAKSADEISEPQKANDHATLETSAVIDELQNIADGDVGYMPTQTGGGFLPLGTSELGALLLGQAAPANSGVLRELVKRGAAAVPELIAHLDDSRPTKMTLSHEGMMGGLFFDDEYDFNRRTSQSAPADVNRRFGGDEKHPNQHTVTVGDLCFVALGQIVNRRFNAVRYQPTACIMINSPTYSKRLRSVIQKEWGQLTPEQHKESLIQDFVQPDSEYRRTGACLRLGYYYPDALEPLVLKQLAEPRYNVFDVHELIREKLYRTEETSERKKLCDAFVAKHGEVARQGIHLRLFDDLQSQEADEEGRRSPRLEEKYAARACLIELFGHPAKVKSKDQPHLFPVENSTQARFIDTLVFFPSEKVDQAVRQVLHSTEEDYLARACVRYLIGRGADADIRQYVEPRLPDANEKRRKELDRLQECLGWSPLHLAAEIGNPGKIEDLIHQGADINARAANGQSPLHVAADHGSYEAIRTLLDRKADPNLKDHQGRTPLQLAIGYESAVELLLAGGAEPTDIFAASFAGSDRVVQDLLAKDKTLAVARTESGETPLHIAAQRDQVKVAEVLIAFGADVNAIDNDRNKLTPLHRAASYAGPEMVTLLLKHKADRNAKSWDGRDALAHARDNKNEETIQLLQRGR